MLSQTVTVAGGISCPSKSSVSKRTAGGLSHSLPCHCVSFVSHSLTRQTDCLSSSLAGCPPEHLFLITRLRARARSSDDPSVDLFTCLSLVHLPLVSLVTMVHDDRTCRYVRVTSQRTCWHWATLVWCVCTDTELWHKHRKMTDVLSAGVASETYLWSTNPRRRTWGLYNVTLLNVMRRCFHFFYQVHQADFPFTPFCCCFLIYI